MWDARAGAHEFKVVIDEARDGVEITVFNNSSSFAFEGTLLPDLVVDAIAWTPGNAPVGSLVTFTVWVRNDGSGDTPPFTVSVFPDGESKPTWRVAFPAIASGQVENESFSWVVDAGDHVFRIVLDEDGDIAGEIEGNNERTFRFPL